MTMERVMSTEPDTDTDTDGDVGVAAEDGRRARDGRRNPLVIAGVVLVVVATACAVVFGVLWYTASHDDSLNYSKLRDDALRAAEQGSINLTTLDYRNVQQGLNRWKDSTTGALYGQLTSGSLVTTFSKQAQQAKSITTGKVLDGVITSLDEHAGQAQALVYVDVTVTTAGGQPTEKRLPLQWQLTLTNSGWKLACYGPCSSSGQ
jgi:Mce-associated membrane protein